MASNCIINLRAMGCLAYLSADLAPISTAQYALAERLKGGAPRIWAGELGFSGFMAHVDVGADEPFRSEIGTLLQIALCCRNSLYNTTT